MKTEFGLLLALAVLSLALSSSGQGLRRQDQPLTDELYALVDDRAKLIKDNIARSSSEWAGTYFSGDHHPTVFMWTPEQGFLVTSSLHTFSPSWINYGGVTLTETSLIIRPELPKDNQYAHLMDTEFRLVKWDKQHFLIPPRELKQFAYAVHSQAGSQIVEFFSKGEDRDGPPRGLPDLPAEYAVYMKMPPIVARVAGVGPAEGFQQTITINVGRRHRVIEGMIFYYVSRNGSRHFSLRVKGVSETSSLAEISSIGGTDENVKVTTGLRVTSRIPQNFVEPG